MPSYRLHVPLGALRPGVDPPSLLEQAALALGSRHVVERTDVEAPMVNGRRVGRVVLRFLVEDTEREAADAQARLALAAVVEHLEASGAQVAPADAVLLTRGAGGRFRPIPPW